MLELWVDRGGTFTDCIVVDDGRIVAVSKLLSADDAPARALRRALQLDDDAPLPPCAVRLGTTLATNALLQRRVARCALVVTRGFADLVEIGTQQRPELFALQIVKPAPLYEKVVEIDARAAADGAVLVDVDDPAVANALAPLRAAGIDALAVAVMHGHKADHLERRVADVARRLGFTHVALSSDQGREPGLLARAETALVDAAVTPVLSTYVAALRAAFAGSELRFMTSSGGLVDASRFTGPAAILSGPAGGIVAARVAAERAACPRAIGLDMGGTSTDVCVVTATSFDAAREREVAGVRVRAPMLPIHTVAAGGGSICRFDGARFTVGPDSAGAAPGPLCYGRADAVELTLTDVDLLSGRLVGDRFPFPLDPTRARVRVEELRAAVAASGVEKTFDEVLAGFTAIADAAMADAARQVCVVAGEDPRAHALVVFGGAGGQHACAIARRLGATTLIVPPLSGVLSAWGIGHAPIVAHGEADAGPLPLDDAATLAPALDRVAAAVRATVTAEARASDDVVVQRAADLRYRGTETSLTVPFGDAATMRAAFEARHAKVFGYARPGHAIDVVVVRADAASVSAAVAGDRLAARGVPVDAVAGSSATSSSGGAPRSPVAPSATTASTSVTGVAAPSSAGATRAAAGSQDASLSSGSPPFSSGVASPLSMDAPSFATDAPTSAPLDDGVADVARPRAESAGVARARAVVETSPSGSAASPTGSAAPPTGSAAPPTGSAAPPTGSASPSSKGAAEAEQVRVVVAPGAQAAQVAETRGEGASRDVDVAGGSGRSRVTAAPNASRPLPSPRRTVRLVDDGDTVDAPLWFREDLAVATTIHGPALVADATSTLVVAAGFRCAVLADGALRLDDERGEARERPPLEQDPIELELFDRAFTSIAEEMGEVLRRTAISTNIRERLDFSCAVFDHDGSLVANAPHIPVHLGAMSESIRALLDEHPDPAPGDVFVVNDPRRGGSHLPDITVLSPVHDDDARVFFVASRGHHADVGGTTPGSMPPFARHLDEEGVVFPMLRMVRGGVFDEALVRGVLASGPWPARDPSTNVADLEAMIAANHAGAARLLDLAHRRGAAVVQRYMRNVVDDAAREVTAALRRVGDGRRTYGDALDDGTPITVTVDVVDGRARVDFTGTGAAQQGNLNAPRAVVVAAVLYVLRLLIGKRVPLSSGMLQPIDLVLPPGSLVDPPPGAAVAGGNVETSQRIVDVLLAAFGLMAASQGTMNNLTFGDETFGYYETICGGAGAGPGFAGASAVHTHMTNTRITDPEVMEARFPVRVEAFAVRRGSGGSGQFGGGDGVVRAIRALRPLTVSILSERRTRAPFGLKGGGDGQPGRNTIDGVDVSAKARATLAAGHVVQIETPGGGAWGAAQPPPDVGT